MALAGAEHRDGVPVRRLDQHVAGRVRHLGRLAAHDAAEADDPRVVGDDKVLARQGPLGAVQRGHPLALDGPADPDRALQLVEVVAVDRATGLEHDVVGDVHGERDRAHAGVDDAFDHPGRRGRGRVEAGDRPGHEDGATDRVVDVDLVAVGVRLRHVAQRRVVEGRVEGQRRLAGDAAQGEPVGAVGVDLELDDLLSEAEGVERVVAGLTGVGRQHDDAVVVVADAELAARADHAGGDVAVGLAGGDLEASWQHASRQDHDHQVAGPEVVGAADDALRLPGAVGVGDVDRAPVDGLAVLLGLGLHGQDLADHERALDAVGCAVDRLELEPEVGQPVGQLLGRHLGRQVDVVLDPGERCLHAAS